MVDSGGDEDLVSGDGESDVRDETVYSRIIRCAHFYLCLQRIHQVLTRPPHPLLEDASAAAFADWRIKVNVQPVCPGLAPAPAEAANNAPCACLASATVGLSELPDVVGLAVARLDGGTVGERGMMGHLGPPCE